MSSFESFIVAPVKITSLVPSWRIAQKARRDCCRWALEKARRQASKRHTDRTCTCTRACMDMIDCSRAYSDAQGVTGAKQHKKVHRRRTGQRLPQRKVVHNTCPAAPKCNLTFGTQVCRHFTNPRICKSHWRRPLPLSNLKGVLDSTTACPCKAAKRLKDVMIPNPRRARTSKKSKKSTSALLK